MSEHSLSTEPSALDLLPENIRQILTRNGIKQLHPPQEEAIQNGILEERNMVLAMPTAAGKTLIAEIAMLKTILAKKGNCLYMVPLKALAAEKFDDFTRKYRDLGISVGIATGDYDYVDFSLTKHDILIATAEKVDSLLRQKPDWLCSRLACVIADEIHYLDDPGRGPTLETVITRLRHLNDRIRIIGLSATIANAQDIAGWLDAGLVSSTWRPVALKEGVYFEGNIRFADGSERNVDLGTSRDEVAALALDCIKDNGQVLIFLNTRKSAQAEAQRIAKELGAWLNDEQRERLLKLSRDIDSDAGESTKIGKQLADCLRHGVAFHHAGLNLEQRKLIEDHFRQNLIKVICATPTLAVGVNLPSRRTIIKSLYRYASGAGMRPISVMEYKQMSGRAGRPGYDPYGEAVLFAKSRREQGEFFTEFIFADTEPIRSQLGTESALRVHLLASIVSGFITSESSAFDFIKKTFFSYQERSYDISELIIRILGFLEREGMLLRKGNSLLATAFGSRISRLYIDPISAVIIRDCLSALTESTSSRTLLYLVCCLPDMFTLSFGRADIEKVMPFADRHSLDFQLPLDIPTNYSEHLAKIKTVWMLSCWMEEEKEDTVCTQFGIGPGDIHRIVDTAEWLAYATVEIAKLFKIPGMKSLTDLRTQLRYGVKPELLELVSLKGIGRMRARSLFTHHLRSIKDLQQTPLESLQRVPLIGKEIGQAVKVQVEKL